MNLHSSTGKQTGPQLNYINLAVTLNFCQLKTIAEVEAFESLLKKVTLVSYFTEVFCIFVSSLSFPFYSSSKQRRTNYTLRAVSLPFLSSSFHIFI